MKIEVTHTHQNGCVDTVSVESELLAPKHIPRAAQFLLGVANGTIEPENIQQWQDWFKLATAPEDVKGNVNADDAKQDKSAAEQECPACGSLIYLWGKEYGPSCNGALRRMKRKPGGGGYE